MSTTRAHVRSHLWRNRLFRRRQPLAPLAPEQHGEYCVESAVELSQKDGRIIVIGLIIDPSQAPSALAVETFTLTVNDALPYVHKPQPSTPPVPSPLTDEQHDSTAEEFGDVVGQKHIISILIINVVIIKFPKAWSAHARLRASSPRRSGPTRQPVLGPVAALALGGAVGPPSAALAEEHGGDATSAAWRH